jgi:hypothetical protein
VYTAPSGPQVQHRLRPCWAPSSRPSWSPDSNWLVYTKQLKSLLRAVFVCELATGKIHQLTDGLTDARAEVEVYRQFRDMAEGKSVLLISHRLGSARLADRILFLEEGRIVEEGPYADLVRRNGRYARMHSIQAAWYHEAPST